MAANPPTRTIEPLPTPGRFSPFRRTAMPRLLDPTTVNPSFVADVAGTYVAQLIVSDPFLSSNPSTVTITAGTFTITLSPNPLNLTSAPGTLTLTLDPTAATPVSVGLSGFDPTVISVPTSVMVPANTSGVNVNVTPLASGTTGLIATHRDTMEPLW